MSRIIVRIFTSHNSECTLFLLANILPEVHNANLLLQRNYTTGVSIYGIITNLLRKLQNRTQDDFSSYRVAELFENCPIKQADDLKNYLDYLFSISIFDELDIEKVKWKFIQQCSTFVANQTIDLDDLYNDFSHIKSKYIDLKERFSAITTQVQSFIVPNLGQSKYNGASVKNGTNLCNDFDLSDNPDDSDTNDDKPDGKIYKHKKTNKSIRPDHLWAYLLDGEHVPNSRKLIEFLFAIPTSNSFCGMYEVQRHACTSIAYDMAE
ncbi:unnamed protein product [Rotaria socialis]|uniref:Uncharacterized protein n=1 Tax=Rotaria socialis TaxID=392032 RepID=A0A821LIG7_9BILA|nr:unnamed protein product [Rotaria socialis]